MSNSTIQQITSLSQLHIVRQIGFVLLIAAGISLGTTVVMWSNSSEYTAIYLEMSSQDSNEVISYLEQNGTEYKIANGVITVPSDKVQQARLQLASNGLPRTTNKGYSFLEDEQNLGTSNFIEQARYNRALEQELVETIKHIQGVRDARVHLSIPRQSSFIRNANEPSASVMVDLINPQSLNDTQLTGILHLVASSVAKLEAENVSVIDQRGNLLSQRSNSDLNDSNENIRFSRAVEDDYNNRIINILTPIVGAGNVKAQVSANLDFTFIETTEETYNPTSGVVRSEQIQEESSGSTSNANIVEPGTLSPTPPPDDTGADVDQGLTNNTQNRTNSTRNYEIDRSISLIRSTPGTVNRLSVAVLVDLHAQETADGAVVEEGSSGTDPEADQLKIDRITQLVKDSIGFDEERGDSVNVISEQFFETPVEVFTPESIPIWQQAWVLPAAKQLGAGIVVILLIFGVLRPAMKTVVSNESTLPNRNTAALPPAEASNANIAENQQIGQSAEAPAISAPSMSAYDDNLNLSQQLVQQEPARAARMIKNWVANG